MRVVGVVKLILEVVVPTLHKYELPPVTLNVSLSPVQTVSLPVIIGTIFAGWVRVIVSFVKQPLESVMVI